MNFVRTVGLVVGASGAIFLAGCVGVAGPGYDSYDPYYGSPGPVVVPGSSVYIEGGGYYGRPYYGRPYYGRPYYDRPGYPQDHGHGGDYRPGWNGPPQAARPPQGPLPRGVPRLPDGQPPLAGSVMRPPPGVAPQTGPALADRP